MHSVHSSCTTCIHNTQTPDIGIEKEQKLHTIDSLNKTCNTLDIMDTKPKGNSRRLASKRRKKLKEIEEMKRIQQKSFLTTSDIILQSGKNTIKMTQQSLTERGKNHCMGHF